MGARYPNPRLVKIHRNYSVEDIARLFGVHKNTVRSWLKRELAAIDDRRPMLILGRELLRFVQERRRKAKQTCGPGRIFCIACRAPKVPAGKMADCTATGPMAGSLCGICPDCGRLIYRRVNPTKIDAVRGELEIAFTQPRPRLLGERAAPSVNCDSGEKAQAHENA
jgi:Helix-turn-helix domain